MVIKTALVMVAEAQSAQHSDHQIDSRPLFTQVGSG